MGIFNEQSFDDPFAKGIQGAPGGGGVRGVRIPQYRTW